jgi:hypothetical protein
VQHQPACVAAEGVGQDDVGAGVDESLVQRPHALRMLEVPGLGRIARRQAHGEKIRAGCAVGEQDFSGIEQGGEHV